MTGVAVKVTEVPAHTGLDEATIETLTGSGVVTAIEIVLEVAGLPEVHESEEVKTQLTRSVLAGT